MQQICFFFKQEPLRVQTYLKLNAYCESPKKVKRKGNKQRQDILIPILNKN